jgi:beta-glucosidase
MASYASWTDTAANRPGQTHGNRYLLTDVLKQRLGFDGFVVRLNGIEQIPAAPRRTARRRSTPDRLGHGSHD